MMEKRSLLRFVADQLPNLPHIQAELRAFADELEAEAKKALVAVESEAEKVAGAVEAPFVDHVLGSAVEEDHSHDAQ